jgi:hypothetical protein
MPLGKFSFFGLGACAPWREKRKKQLTQAYRVWYSNGRKNKIALLTVAHL